MRSARLRGVVLVVAAAALAGVRADAAPEIVVEGVPPASELGATLEAGAVEAHAKASRWFGVELDAPVTVRWVVSDEELRRRGIEHPGAIAGLAVADQSLILLFAPALARQPSRVPAVLLHEMCHLVFAKATAGAEVIPPRWLNEGLAVWISGEWDLGLEWRARDAGLLTDAAAAGSLLPFRSLDASFPGGAFFPLAYAQSHSFVEWLADRRGDDGLRRFVRRLGEDADPEPAFLEVWGIPLERAEREWRESLGRSGWLRVLPSGGTLVTIIWVVVGLLVVAKFVQVRLRMRRSEDEPGWE